MTTDPAITITGLRAQISSLETANSESLGGWSDLQAKFDILNAENAAVKSERDALYAELAKVRAAGAAASAADALRGARQVINEERATVARLTARVADLEADNFRSTRDAREIREAMAKVANALGCAHDADAVAQSVAALKARPVLTTDMVARVLPHAVASTKGWVITHPEETAKAIVEALGSVTPPPAQDDPMRHHESRDYALQSPDNGYWPADVGVVNGTEALTMGAMLRSVGPFPVNDAALLAMARAAISCVDKLGAPATTPTAAPDRSLALTAASLLRDIVMNGGLAEGGEIGPRASDYLDMMRRLETTPTRLDATTIAPVDPEAVARAYHDNDDGPPCVPTWIATSSHGRAIAAMRATLTAHGIPVTPEGGK